MVEFFNNHSALRVTLFIFTSVSRSMCVKRKLVKKEKKVKL